MKKFSRSLAEIAKLYGVAKSVVNYWNINGYDLDDDNLLKGLAAKSKRRKGVNLTPSAPINISLNEEKGIRGALERLRTVELELSKAYRDALTSGSETSTAIKHEWFQAIEQLRRAEKETPDVLKDNDQVVNRDEVTASLIETFTKLRTSLEQVPVRVTKELPVEYVSLITDKLRKEINVYIEELYNFKFLKNTKEDDEETS